MEDRLIKASEVTALPPISFVNNLVDPTKGKTLKNPPTSFRYFYSSFLFFLPFFCPKTLGLIVLFCSDFFFNFFFSERGLVVPRVTVDQKTYYDFDNLSQQLKITPKDISEVFFPYFLKIVFCLFLFHPPFSLFFFISLRNYYFLTPQIFLLEFIGFWDLRYFFFCFSCFLVFFRFFSFFFEISLFIIFYLFYSCFFCPFFCCFLLIM